MADGFLCQGCGIEAPTRYVEFHQNIGMLVMRQSKSLKGNMCKKCLHSNFWSMTGTTLAIGWLGTISIILAPFFVLNNVIRYLSNIGMPAVPADARKPMVDNAAIQQIFPILDTVFSRVNAGEKLPAVCQQMAPQVGVTPGQLMSYAVTVAQQQIAQQRAARSVGGFPVVPAKS